MGTLGLGSFNVTILSAVRAVDVGGKRWSIRRQDRRRAVENEAVRTGEIGGEDWKVRRRDQDWQGGADEARSRLRSAGKIFGFDLRCKEGERDFWV
ncbi:hypothetical protein CMV_006439 [Castanea mollissima]|uniref:Uncharacterized protein n=1 Tax=Castanea mollissima TaxID=60419 RepID=A0A8J4RNE8_9ROSI|nr:hypothetical protein CMV_006439 [Castanea mollissima]